MKKILSKQIVLISLCFLSMSLYAQITKTKVTDKKQEVSNLPYDSLSNFLDKNVYQYVGQTFYLKERPDDLRKFGYDNFLIDYKKDKTSDKTNTYKCCDKFNSKYSDLAGKYFNVLEVIKHPKAEQNDILYGQEYFLKIEEKETKEIAYYQYSSRFEHSFPFIVVGYFEKMKLTYKNVEFILRGKNWVDGKTAMFDIETGKEVDFSAGTIWKCIDLTIEEKYYTLSLLLTNSNGNKLALGLDNVLKGTNFAFTKLKAEKLKKLHGNEIYNLIISGKLKIGMTTEMCLLSWGNPQKVNETINSNGKTEQWVYRGKSLYFENGKLKTIQ